MENGMMTVPEAQPQSAGEMAVVTREQSEIQAAIISAKKFPRNEQQAFVKAIKSFSRPTMAEAATYSFPRGGKTIQGPSVDCARELARCWQNVRYGVRIISRNDKEMHIKGFAYDAETNNYVESEAHFMCLVQRKVDSPQGRVTKWVEPDERDLRELINKHGAIAVRNCILQILPPDLVDDVLATATNTLEKKSKNELSTNREDVVKRLVVTFDRIGVSVPMLETKLGHSLDTINESELVEFQQILHAIREGVAKREEYFSFETKAQDGGEEKPITAKLNDKLKAKLKE